MEKPEDTEDKPSWMEFGEQREDTFVEKIAPTIGIDACINPDKVENPAAFDLLVDGEPAELKTQETPFFTAEKKYGLSPQYAVTFNSNDYYRYKKKEGLDIYFWVRWRDRLSGYGIEVEEMEGVWRISFQLIKEMVEEESVPLHGYQRRKEDQENANSSYLLDLRKMDCIECFIGPCEK